MPVINKIFSRLKGLYEQHKPIFFFTLISLISHLLFLSEFSLSLPDMNEGQQSIEMRLVQLTKKPAQAQTNITAPEPEIKHESVQLTETPQDTPEPPINQRVEPSIIEDSPTSNVQEEAPITQQESQTEVTETNSLTTASETASDSLLGSDTTSSASSNEASQKPSQQGYKYVESEFDVIRGNDKSAAGTAKIIFSTQENKTYNIQSITEANGLASLIFGKLLQTSEGTTSERGLRPNYYQYKYGDNKKTQTANFAWSDGIVEMNNAKGRKIEPLVDGTQDLLSFMYQFMFTPPLDTNEIIISNGKNLRTYSYIFQGEVLLKTKFGDLRTIHLQKSGDDDEKTELWLAIDYQNLPVKIRKTEKDGSSIEQIVVRISTVAP